MLTQHSPSFEEDDSINNAIYKKSQKYAYEEIVYDTQIYPQLLNNYLERVKDDADEYYPDLFENYKKNELTQALNYVENIILIIFGPVFKGFSINMNDCYRTPINFIAKCKASGNDLLEGLASIKVEDIDGTITPLIKILQFISHYRNGNIEVIDMFGDNFCVFEKEFCKAFKRLLSVVNVGTKLHKGIKSFLSSITFKKIETTKTFTLPKHVQIVEPDNDDCYTRPVIVINELEFKNIYGTKAKDFSKKLFLSLIKTSCSLVDAIIFNRCLFSENINDEVDEKINSHVVFENCEINSIISVGKNILQQWIFNNSSIRGTLDFSKAHFSNGISFNKCFITGTLNMDSASFAPEQTFTDTKKCICYERTPTFKIQNIMFIGKCLTNLANISFTIPVVIRNVSMGSRFMFACSTLNKNVENDFKNITFVSTRYTEYIQARADFCDMLKRAALDEYANMYKIITNIQEPEATQEVHYTIAEAARYLGIPASTISSWKTAKKPKVKFYETNNGNIYFLKKDLDEYKTKLKNIP